MQTLETILAELLKEAPAVLPLFVHNPKSQTITAVILGSADAVLSAVAAVQAAKPAQPAA